VVWKAYRLWADAGWARSQSTEEGVSLSRRGGEGAAREAEDPLLGQGNHEGNESERCTSF